MKDIDIIKEFYNQFYRVPMYKEYRALGGSKCKVSYFTLINHLGYQANSKGRVKTIEVLKDNEVIFTGVSAEVAEELDCSQQWVRKCVRDSKPIRGHTLRYKLFEGHL